jgi:hypothetical protein
VYAAGNISNLMAQVITAAAEGVMAGARINADLIEEETRWAVEGRFGPFSAAAEAGRGLSGAWLVYRPRS